MLIYVHIEIEGILCRRQRQQQQDWLKKCTFTVTITAKFESITIRELTEKAGINRGVPSYLHYVDKIRYVWTNENRVVQNWIVFLLKEAQ